jgi:hypothetical protein
VRARRAALALRLIVAATTALAAQVALPAAAFAQANKPKYSAKLSADRVEVGEPFTFELRITTQDSDPVVNEIELPAGLHKVGEDAMRGGGRTRQMIVSWRLMAVKPGRFTIPGPAIQWNNQRFAPAPVKVEVTAATGRRVSPSNPFMLPGGMTIRMFGDDDDGPSEQEKPELALPSAPDRLIFLRAVADKKAVVIGEQVTVTFYAYFNANLHPEESHDAPFDDFRTVSIVDEPGTQQGALFARAGADRFNVKVIGRIAAFPLKAGTLHTGTAKMKLSGLRAGQYAERESNDEIITVTEPPIDYRPPGYRFGDVGQFKLEALVQARRIDEGGAVPVLLTVTGAGSFPDSIRVPDRTGLEWLDPEKKEKLAIQGGSVTGSRSFGYVVRVKDTGTVDLGAVELSYWNPAARRYEITKADLGKVEVTRKGLGLAASAKAATSSVGGNAADGAVVDPFVGLATPRLALGAYTAARPPFWGDGGVLWGLLAAPPLLVGVAFAGSLGLRKARARRLAGAESKSALAEHALADADDAEAAGDMKALAAALERAVHLAVEGATGLRSRGVLIADLPRELAPLGVAPALADDVRDALLAVESIRFDPDGAAAARDLGERARRVVHELAQLTPAAT